MTILVTGSRGMIGSQLVRGLLAAGHVVVGVNRQADAFRAENYISYQADLDDEAKLRQIADTHRVDRFIHLAALAHRDGQTDLSWARYYHINVECAQHVFEAAGDRPVLYISTVDVVGFYDGKTPVGPDCALHPVSNYGKSKAMAEAACRKLPSYSIFRLSPVYTDTVKRDIQKRYYLKYPNIAYRIGKGQGYEILHIDRAVQAMVSWCEERPANDIRFLKDPDMMWTPDYLRAEKAAGRAKFVLPVPRWMVDCGYGVLKTLLGENEKTYLLNKAVHPLRTV